LKLKINSGPGVARNLGINESFSKYIYFLDSDDFLLNPCLLEDLYNLAENNLDCCRIVGLDYSELEKKYTH
jgi:glycosyltransferase involved in cell wall biosynthesis